MAALPVIFGLELTRWTFLLTVYMASNLTECN